MNLFVGLLLLATIVIDVVSSNNGNNGDGTNAGSSSGNSATNSGTSNSNSSNNENKISNNTITHHTTFDTKLNHLVVDRNTGRVSQNTSALRQKTIILLKLSVSFHSHRFLLAE